MADLGEQLVAGREIEHVGDDACRGIVGDDVAVIVAIGVATRRCVSVPIGGGNRLHAVVPGDRLALRKAGTVWLVSPCSRTALIVLLKVAAVIRLKVAVVVSVLLRFGALWCPVFRLCTGDACCEYEQSGRTGYCRKLLEDCHWYSLILTRMLGEQE